VSEKYQFIDAEYAQVPAGGAGNAPTITCMCKWLGVSKSGFYDWRSRPESATARRRELLKIKIKALLEANDSTCGYRRVHAALARGGEQAGPELVRQLLHPVRVHVLKRRSWAGLVEPAQVMTGCPVDSAASADWRGHDSFAVDARGAQLG
jgi:putative transposase